MKLLLRMTAVIAIVAIIIALSYIINSFYLSRALTFQDRAEFTIKRLSFQINKSKFDEVMAILDKQKDNVYIVYDKSTKEIKLSHYADQFIGLNIEYKYVALNDYIKNEDDCKKIEQLFTEFHLFDISRIYNINRITYSIGTSIYSPLDHSKQKGTMISFGNNWYYSKMNVS